MSVAFDLEILLRNLSKGHHQKYHSIFNCQILKTNYISNKREIIQSGMVKTDNELLCSH